MRRFQAGGKWRADPLVIVAGSARAFTTARYPEAPREGLLIAREDQQRRCTGFVNLPRFRSVLFSSVPSSSSAGTAVRR
jgi:hypothetical protein